MRFADLVRIGLECPQGADPQANAWEYLERDSPRFSFCGFRNGPGAEIEARKLAGNRYLVLETPGWMEGLENVFMGEVVTAVPERGDTLRITSIENPLQFAHYSLNSTPRGTPLHDLVIGLGGEWESNLGGYLNFVHIPLLDFLLFERQANVFWERLA